MSVGLTKCWEVQEIQHSKAKEKEGETNKEMVGDFGVLQQPLLYLIFVPWYSKNISLLKYSDLDLQ